MSPNPLTTNRSLFLVSVLGVVVVFGYALFVASPYLLGPSLTVTSPTPNHAATGATVTITGKTERVAYLSINDQPVPLSEDGSFTAERAFPSGYTVLVIEARDRFGRTTQQTVNFVLTHNTTLNVAQSQEVSSIKEQ